MEKEAKTLHGLLNHPAQYRLLCLVRGSLRLPAKVHLPLALLFIVLLKADMPETECGTFPKMGEVPLSLFLECSSLNRTASRAHEFEVLGMVT